MKAAIVLLIDRDVSNVVCKLAWDLHLTHRLGVSVRRLPPHISLKQPFEIADTEALVGYFDELASSLSPFTITLTHFALWEYPPEKPDSGILILAAHETPALRSLHTTLSRQLSERFDSTEAPFDGDDYTFHITIAAGVGSVEAYRAAFARCQSLPSSYQFTAKEIALFVYENNNEQGDWQYTLYKTLPLNS